MYDLILDCTDNPASRYLISDAAVLCGIPLVSASALKTEGQLCVLNFEGGPCYRCLFPVPPPANSVVACGDGGILGPVVGMMGVWQSVEAIKVLTGAYGSDGRDAGPPHQKFTPSLHLFSAYGFPPFRSMKMRGRKPACAACGDAPTITRTAIETGDLDYHAFCGTPSMVYADPDERISVQEFQTAVLGGTATPPLPQPPHTLLDVRTKEQFAICALPNSINIPYAQLQTDQNLDLSMLKEPIYVVCRYGNDSQGSVRALKARGFKAVWDIVGGLNKWATDVDPAFPIY